MTDHDLLLQIVHTMDHMAATMATKTDLDNFSTKDDLASFATKDDLASFATKDDLASFSTKDDLSSFATKDDFASFATKDDLKNALEDAKNELYDEIILCEKDIDAIREQLSFFNAAKLEYDNQMLFIKKLSDLETRVEKLEAQTG